MADGGSVPESPPVAPGEPAQPAKVVVMFKATGDAPILKQNKFKARPAACATNAQPRGQPRLRAGPSCAVLAQISANERFGKVVDFLRKQIQRDTVVRARCDCAHG